MFVEEPAAIFARWVFPVSRPPIANGLVSVREGRIIAVGQYGDRDKLELPVRDLGDVALLPGLVNAHTHLEFSGLASPLDNQPGGFCEWIRRIIQHRQERTYSPAEAIAAGLEECRQTQTAVVGEIASQPWQDKLSGNLAGVVFREILGLTPERGSELLEVAKGHLDSSLAGGFRAGLSPHAPYTVSPALVERLAGVAASASAPLAMHLAETTEELELLASHSGPLRRLLEDLGAWRPDAIPRGIRPRDYLRLFAAAPRTLIIHGNYLVGDEIQFIASQSTRMSVVYCPRTHAYFGHSNYPLPQLLAAGVNVALGTDSRASNPDLNLWSEVLAAAASHPQVAPAEFLKIATANGAQALGLNEDFGAIEQGRRAAFCVLPLTGDSAADPYESLLEKTRRGHATVSSIGGWMSSRMTAIIPNR